MTSAIAKVSLVTKTMNQRTAVAVFVLQVVTKPPLFYRRNGKISDQTGRLLVNQGSRVKEVNW